MKEFKKDKLIVKVVATRTEMGQVAAQDIYDRILALLAEKDEINMIFAAAPSQNDVLKSLTEYTDIPWNRINACHMDEYIGLDKNAPQGFGNFLMAHIFGLVPFKSVNLIDCSAKDPEAESERYTEILKKYPTDIVVMGIGENGHIAFNDPPVADFNDPNGDWGHGACPPSRSGSRPAGRSATGRCCSPMLSSMRSRVVTLAIRTPPVPMSALIMTGLLAVSA